MNPATAVTRWRKSTYSNGAQGNCVEVGIGHLDPCTFRTSTRSSGGNGNCVEVANGNTVMGVRDSKDRDGGTLVVPAAAWSQFLTGVQR